MSQPLVIDSTGQRASLEAQAEGRATLRLDDGRRLDVPEDLLVAAPDGSYRSTLPFHQLVGEGAESASASEGAFEEETVFLEVEERLKVGRQERETGRVRISRRVETRDETVDETGWREHIDVERVPVGRYVEEAAPARSEGDTTVIPVYEEVLVVERRLRLAEEIRVTKRREEVREPQRVTLRRTVVDVERDEGDAPSSSSAS